MITYEVKIKGVDEQIKKLKGYNRITKKRLKEATDKSVLLLERRWKKIAPVDTGRYRSSISGRVRSVMGGDVVGIVGTNVKSATGFPYPTALEESRRYHYRTGPRAGQFTMNRVKRILKRARRAIKKEFNAAVKNIIKDLTI